jgi:hypothetical protein
LFHAQLISVHADKRCVYKVIYVLFIIRCIESMHTNPSCLQIFFADIFPMPSSFFDKISNKGGGRHGHHVCVRSISGGGVNDCDPKRERSDGKSSRGSGTVRVAGQQKLTRQQDGKGGGGRQ